MPDGGVLLSVIGIVRCARSGLPHSMRQLSRLLRHRYWWHIAWAVWSWRTGQVDRQPPYGQPFLLRFLIRTARTFPLSHRDSRPFRFGGSHSQVSWSRARTIRSDLWHMPDGVRWHGDASALRWHPPDISTPTAGMANGPLGMRCSDNYSGFRDEKGDGRKRTWFRRRCAPRLVTAADVNVDDPAFRRKSKRGGAFKSLMRPVDAVEA